MQVPLLSGVYVDANPDFRTALPLNYVPTPKDQGISKGYFRPADGLVQFAGGAPGICRGSIVWNGVCYMVMGGTLVRVSSSGTLIALGGIVGTGTVSMDYSFDRLGIAAGGSLYYYNQNEGVTRLTDGDALAVVDALYIDGYWVITDGASIAQTELNDPYNVLPTKYGSSEADPDPIIALWRLRDELVALNRHTCEFFQNVGGSGFSFQRQPAAMVMAGPVGTHTVCEFDEGLAILGGGRNEPPSVYLIGGGDRVPLATAEIDQILAGYTESQLANCLLEARNYNRHQQLFLHLPDRTLVYDLAATKALSVPVWFELGSSSTGSGQYRAQNWVWAYDRWLFGDPQAARIGYAVDNVSSHYGQKVAWHFTTSILYNEGLSAVIHSLELVALPGQVPLAATPTVSTSYSRDGQLWSQERSINAGRQGERLRRLVWLQQGLLGHFRIQRFRGTSDAHMPIARLEAVIEPLAV